MASVPYNHEVLVETLIYHQRHNLGRCLCGWAEPGKSHAQHVATVYEMAMLYEQG
jgi:hypothetical protein